jgi:hypothetical protein
MKCFYGVERELPRTTTSFSNTEVLEPEEAAGIIARAPGV